MQTNWAQERFEDEAAWVQRTADETGWPHAIVAYADFSADDVRPQLDRLARYPLVRGVRMQLHWHENPQYRFAARPDLCADPDDPPQHRASRRLWLELRPAGVRAADGRTRPILPRPVRRSRSCCSTPGMLEDLSRAGRAEWRAGMVRLAACPNVVCKLSGLGTFLHRNDPAHIADVVARDASACSAPDRCLFGSNFPIEKLWTDYRASGRRLSRRRRSHAQRHRDAILHDTAMRVYRIAPEPEREKTNKDNREEIMALEIKILDYGDIELESSFLVLGRDCGRTRRVPTLGFLILGGPYPIVVDTGYRSNQIMETLGMRGLQFHENMIENQLAKHGVRMGDVRFVLHTHLHIDHAGKDDLFPMNTTVVVNRQRARIFRLRPACIRNIRRPTSSI